jgi:hypothetical protein
MEAKERERLHGLGGLPFEGEWQEVAEEGAQ